MDATCGMQSRSARGRARGRLLLDDCDGYLADQLLEQLFVAIFWFGRAFGNEKLLFTLFTS
jgi:hypothetical protein